MTLTSPCLLINTAVGLGKLKKECLALDIFVPLILVMPFGLVLDSWRVRAQPPAFDTVLMNTQQVTKVASYCLTAQSDEYAVLPGFQSFPIFPLLMIMTLMTAVLVRSKKLHLQMKSA